MALPHISEPGQVGLMLNLDHYEEAGTPPISWDSSLENLVNAAIKLTRTKGGRKLFGFVRSIDYDYLNWVTTMVRPFGGPVGMPSVCNDPELLRKFPAWEEWARVMANVGPNHTAANLRGKELEDASNQNVMAIMVQEVGVKEGLARVREECQKMHDRSITT